jgi:hypothetical protein
MTRGTVRHRISRVEEALRQLRAKRPFPLLEFATEEEMVRIAELLGNLKEIKEPLNRQISPEKTPELWALFETLSERLNARRDQQ